MNGNTLTRTQKIKMSETLNEIRRRVGEENLTTSCSSSKCSVDMSGLPIERVVVDVDLAFNALGRTGKHCDKILFYICPNNDQLVIVLIENKGGTFNSAKDVADQLRGGADYAKSVVPAKIIITCVPVLFHGSGTHKSQYRKLMREKIRFKGREFVISKSKCNVNRNLADVLFQAKVLT